jgi:hypothetical protein
MTGKEAEHVIGKTIFAVVALVGGLFLAVMLYRNNPDIVAFNTALKRQKEIHNKWMDRIHEGKYP